MPFPRQVTRADQKLGDILSQIGGFGARLNSLAIQHATYRSIAAAAIAAAFIFTAAIWLPPLEFLAAVAVVSIAALIVIVGAIRSGWSMIAGRSRAAQIADRRADLKGRLTTIAELGARPVRGALWPYLIEDALAHRDEFKAERLERHRVERSIWYLCAAVVIAALAIPLARMHRLNLVELPGGLNGLNGEITMNLDDLQLRPAEPGDDDGLELKADAQTMRALEGKLSREGFASGAGSSSSTMMNRARSLASRFQNAIRGDSATHHPRLTLKLADADANQAAVPPTGNSAPAGASSPGDTAGQFQRDNPVDNQRVPLPPIDNSVSNDRQQEASAGNPTLLNTQPRSSTDNSTQSSSSPARANQRANQSNNGGPSHGIGADPNSLFGAQANSTMGPAGFEISIQARPLDHGTQGAGEAYLPPRVETPLNASQAPDQPIARAAVPAEDRATIERVFER